MQSFNEQAFSGLKISLDRFYESVIKMVCCEKQCISITLRYSELPKLYKLITDAHWTWELITLYNVNNNNVYLSIRLNRQVNLCILIKI